MIRRNPPSGRARFSELTVDTLNVGTLTVATLRAGYVGDTPDDNAEHVIHGHLVITGAADTIVLTVEQHAHYQETVSMSRLEVGLTTAPDPNPYGDPYPGSPYDTADPYPDIYVDGYSPPERTGATIDASGDMRTSGSVLSKNARMPLVLRTTAGDYYSFAVGPTGVLATIGTYIGSVPP